MQHNDRPLRRGLQVGQHAGRVQPNRGGIEITVPPRFEPCVPKNVQVVAPRRVGHVDDGARHELGDEVGPDAQAACAGQTLDGGDASVGQRGRSLPQQQPRRRLVEGGKPFDRQVLLVWGGCDEAGFRFAHDIQDVRFQVLRPVGSHPQVQAVGVGVRPKRFRYAQDGVGRGLGDVGEAGRGHRGGGGGRARRAERGWLQWELGHGCV